MRFNFRDPLAFLKQLTKQEQTAKPAPIRSDRRELGEGLGEFEQALMSMNPILLAGTDLNASKAGKAECLSKCRFVFFHPSRSDKKDWWEVIEVAVHNSVKNNGLKTLIALDPERAGLFPSSIATLKHGQLIDARKLNFYSNALLSMVSLTEQEIEEAKKLAMVSDGSENSIKEHETMMLAAKMFWDLSEKNFVKYS